MKRKSYSKEFLWCESLLKKEFPWLLEITEKFYEENSSGKRSLTIKFLKGQNRHSKEMRTLQEKITSLYETVFLWERQSSRLKFYLKPTNQEVNEPNTNTVTNVESPKLKKPVVRRKLKILTEQTQLSLSERIEAALARGCLILQARPVTQSTLVDYLVAITGEERVRDVIVIKQITKPFPITILCLLMPGYWYSVDDELFFREVTRLSKRDLRGSVTHAVRTRYELTLYL